MSRSPIVIPIRVADPALRYAPLSLLIDGSVSIDSKMAKEILASIPPEQKITELLHAEVRYEVTDHCNATCIMCPREEHESGREHGVMDQVMYEKSIDEVASLGAKKIVLTGFGEPMLDRRLERKIAYAKVRVCLPTSLQMAQY